MRRFGEPPPVIPLLRLREAELRALPQRLFARTSRLRDGARIRARPFGVRPEIVYELEPRLLRLLGIEHAVLVNVDDLSLDAERGRIVRRFRDHRAVRVHRAPEIALIAQALRDTPHDRKPMARRRRLRAGKVGIRRVGTADLRERDRHVLDGFGLKAQPSLLLAGQLVVRRDEAPEHVHRLAVFLLIRRGRLVVVGPAQLVERQEVDVPVRRSRLRRVLVGFGRARERLAAGCATLLRRHLEVASRPGGRTPPAGTARWCRA